MYTGSLDYLSLAREGLQPTTASPKKVIIVGAGMAGLNTQALTQAIEQSLAVPFDVVDAAGVRIGGGLTGIYTVVVQAAGKPVKIPNVCIAQNGFTKVVLKKEGQEIGIQILGP